jgi:hypothetical protein
MQITIDLVFFAMCTFLYTLPCLQSINKIETTQIEKLENI